MSQQKTTAIFHKLLVALLVLKFVYFICICLSLALGTLFVNTGSVIFTFGHSLIQIRHFQQIIFTVAKPGTMSERSCSYSITF